MESFATLYVQLDPKLQEFIALAVTAAVSFAILQVSAKLPWLGEYLGMYKVGIVTWITATIVQLLQAGLDKIPMTWDSVAALVMQLVVEVIVVLTGLVVYKRLKFKGHNALR